MAGPGRSGPPSSADLAQVEYATARYRVLLLHCRGLSHTAVARHTGYCERQVRRIVQAAFGEELMSIALSDHASNVLFNQLADYYRETVEPKMEKMKDGPFDVRAFDACLRTLDKMARLMGLN